MTRVGFWKVSQGLIAAAVVAGGCDPVSSRDLHTSAIQARILVSAPSSAITSVRVSLYTTGGYPFDHVKLDGGDALFAEAAGQRQRMGAGSSDYETSFATAAAETSFQVIFDRPPANDVDAPGSSGTLPAPFTLGGISGGVLTWSPSGTADTMSLSLEGSCFEDLGIAIPGDPGTYPMPALERDGLRSSCQATLELRRTRKGVVDANLDPDSSFTLEQLRSATFVAMP